MENRIKNMSGVEMSDKATKLVILLHGYGSSPSKMNHVRDSVLAKYKDANLFIPELTTSWVSFVNPVDIVKKILIGIDELWEDRGGNQYEEIILIGYSLGALLVRKLYVYACGEYQEYLFEPGVDKKRREWVDRVKRIILLAGMNRGWEISHHMPLKRVIVWTVGVAIGNLLLLFKKHPLIFHIRRGSPFLTNLRIQWLAMKQAGVDKAIVIQLLGSVDDMVSPDDNIDLVCGEDFYYIDVPMSGHESVLNLDCKDAIGKERNKIFQTALTKSEAELKKYNISPQDLHDLPSKRLSIQNVVFVIHGIRDQGYWTKKIARRVQKLGREGNITIESETSTYGYFPLLSFLLPWKRREKVEWFMDQYAQALAIYPNAEFSFVGHSHGTYLLAKALQEYPACRFKNVVFAGSVVHTEFDWSKYIDTNQVKAVLNYVATKDSVVAIFPKAFQIFKLQDLGSAGHDGFKNSSFSNVFKSADKQDGEKTTEYKNNPAIQKNLFNVTFIDGDHGAALNEFNWDSIAAFIVESKLELPSSTNIKKERSKLVTNLGYVSPLLWLLALTLLVFIGYLILVNSYLAEWQKTFIFLAYLWSIFRVLTRF
jgi:pimeloyl-ACP methyl ester carboxylesterase